MSGMDRYRKAMLRAYWLPVLLFFGIPCGGLLIVADDLSMTETALLILPFPMTVFVSGYLLAPYFGPKVIKNKLHSFFMAEMCLTIALVVFFGANGSLSLEVLDFSILLIGFFLVLGIFPVIWAGMLFIGACENVGT
jgi:hypothetical protein